MRHSKPFLRLSSESKNAGVKKTLAHTKTTNKHYIAKAIQIGKIQKLRIMRLSKYGAYLGTLPQDSIQHRESTYSAQIFTEVLLPNKFLPPQSAINDELEVFVLTDSDDRLVATTQTPKAQYGDIVELEVIDYAPFGCFLDIGVDKHIFMPTQNPTRFKLHQKVVVVITLDKQSRLIAKTNIKSYLKPAPMLLLHKKIKVFVFEQTPLGFGCVVENAYYGLLYHNELPQGITLNIGTHIDAYIKNTSSHSHQRSDGKLDLTLNPPHSQEQKQFLLNQMPLALDFSASPQKVFNTLQMSKKLFKRLINELTREGKIEFISHKRMFERINKPQKKEIL